MHYTPCKKYSSLQREDFSLARHLSTVPYHTGPSKVCLAQTEARERRMLPGHTKGLGPNEHLLTPCWRSPSACTVHRASFSLFRATRVTFMGVCLSHTALPDHSGRSFALPDPFSLHHNTTEHIESATCLPEEMKHFLFLRGRSTNPHTRICPGTPRG